MHEDHRKRMRQKFLKTGLDGFPPHEVLEIALFFSIPRQNTNPIAHHLIERFGSLPAVFEASYEDLVASEGIGEASAVLIMLIAQITHRYAKDRVQKKQSMDDPAVLTSYIFSQFFGVHNEMAIMICLNNASQLICCNQVSIGTKNSVMLDNRTLAETAFRHNATKVILAHNHPCGLAAPSKEDVERTTQVAELFSLLDISLLDHFIIGEGECFSMLSHPHFAHIFRRKTAPPSSEI